jgi:hypothetical protein
MAKLEQNLFSATPNVLKKVAVATLCMLLMGLFLAVGCVKQKNCDCSLTGKFVYYENTEEIIYCGDFKKVNAVIISDDTTGTDYYYIVGAIPKKFEVKDTLHVSACVKKVPRNGACLAYGVGAIYKLKCIEEEN